MVRFPLRVATLVVCLTALSTALWVFAMPEGEASATPVAVAALVAAALAVEWWPLTLEHRGETMHMTLSGLVTALGILFVGGLPTLLARVLGGAVALAMRWGVHGEKLAFNVVAQSVEVWVIAAVLSLAASDLTNPQVWPVILLAVLMGESASYVCMLLAMRTAAGPLRMDVVRQTLVGSAYSTSISGACAVVGAVLLATDLMAALPLLVVFAVLVLTNRARHLMSERFRTVTALYSFMRAVNSAPATGDVIATILAEAVRVTGAQRAALLLVHDDLAYRFDVDEVGELRGVDVAAPSVRRLVTATRDGLLIPQGSRRPVPALTGDGDSQAMLGSFSTEDVQGVLVFEGRRGNMPDFDTTDVQLAEALSQHAGSAIVTSRLVERLRATGTAMERLALYDRDTGLLNLAGLVHEVPELEADDAVVLIEVPDLELFEATFGHHTANQVVTTIADRLRALEELAVSAVARTTHDRFALILRTADPVSSQRRVRALRTRLQQPMPDTGVNMEVRVHIGVARAATEGTDVRETLRAAASALVRANQESGDTTTWYDPSMDAEATDRIRLASDLRDAIDADQLSLAYQPKVHLQTGVVIGVEALARWVHPERGPVPAETFIDIAERSGLIRPLTLWVIGTAVRQVAAWDEEGWPLTIAINLSTSTMREPSVARTLVAACQDAGVDPHRVTVEVTESRMMRDLERTHGVLAVLDEAGVRLSIDDFGTGWSSLAQLKSLPVDELKIDKTFVTGLARSEDDQAITTAVVAMARRLGLTVVAEGIEDAISLELLRQQGCDVAQGYHVARPMPAADVVRFVTEHAAPTQPHVHPIRRPAG